MGDIAIATVFLGFIFMIYSLTSGFEIDEED